ncbi:unnamed protein product [Cylicocyclus nassatus]|uniref:Uncharacterized protein n=1 Tax=Cylicocyclus nassatus TaxID=53992 RepID=A0AA36GMU4_CYLNA|nr:unnamed protein product [Cylicocyclus nassatus]
MDPDCSDAADFIAYTPQRIIVIVQFAFSLFSVLINCLFYKRWRNKIFFHSNFRILLWALIATNIGHSFLLAVLQGSHLFKIYTATNPCDVLVPGIFCYSLRMPLSACFLAHTTIHLSIVIERTVAFRNLSTYENRKSWLGTALLALSVAAAFAMVVYALWNYDFATQQVYCAGVKKETAFETAAMSYLNVAIEAFTVVMLYFVYRSNKKSDVYDIQSRYQSRENLAVLRLLMPAVISHFVVYSTSMLCIAASSLLRKVITDRTAMRTFVAGTYILPIYTAFSPLLLWWILKHHRRTRRLDLIRMSKKVPNEEYIYFSNYEWNREQIR